MTMQGHTTLKVWLVLAVVFVLGACTGGAVTGFYHSMSRPPKPAPGARLEKLGRDLNLNDDQMKSVGAILDETRNDYKVLRAEVKPRFDETRQKARAKIRALLTPEQQQKFDAMVAQIDEKREGEQQRQR